MQLHLESLIPVSPTWRLVASADSAVVQNVKLEDIQAADASAV